jgi:hypothetical protein
MRKYFFFMLSLLLIGCGQNTSQNINDAAEAVSVDPALEHGADFSGVWTRDNGAGARAHNSSWSREIPDMTPWAREQFDVHLPTFGARAVAVADTNDPVYECYPPGTPRIYLHPFPMEILQMPGRILMIYEYDGIMRNIYTDGREHRDDIGVTWMGDSIGYWDQDVLVVETRNMRDDTWIDREGVPHSEEMTVIERFQLRDENSLWIDIEITDPVALNTPWVTSQAYRKTDWTIEEFKCMDNVSFAAWEDQILEYD